MRFNTLCLATNWRAFLLTTFSNGFLMIVFGNVSNKLRHEQYGRHISDDIFKRIFFNEHFITWIAISLKSVPKRPIDDKSALIQTMAWRQQCWARSTTPYGVNKPRWTNVELIDGTHTWNWNCKWWQKLQKVKTYREQTRWRNVTI